MATKVLFEPDLMVRREVLGLSPIDARLSPPSWYGKAWLEVPVHVVEDSEEQLVTYIASGAAFTFPTGAWPTPDGLHPWHGRDRWQGHGCLMVQRPGDHHAVWHFWNRPDRQFAFWYINLQTAFVRTPAGYDTQDLEVDIVVWPDGRWELKDVDLLADRIVEGRFTPELGAWILELASQLIGSLEAGKRWWDPKWAEWTPDPRWDNPPPLPG